MANSDVVLAGIELQLIDGKDAHLREQDGIAEGRPGRVVVRDFFGGQRRAVQLERDTGWDSLGVGPVYGGQGVEPWPYRQDYEDNTLEAGGAVFDLTPAPRMSMQDRSYIADGAKLWRTVLRTTAGWSDFAQAGTTRANPILALGTYRGDIIACYGAAADCDRYDGQTNTFTGVLLAGLKASFGVGYAREFVYVDPADPFSVKMTTGATPDSYALDERILAMGIHEGRVCIATRTSLWLLGGRPDPTTNKWTQAPVPFFSSGVSSDLDDYCFLLSHGGRLYTWLGNQVQYYEPAEPRQGWRSAGLDGYRCYGATVAGGWLVVTTERRNATFETWAWDGSGWWLIGRSTNTRRVSPLFLGGSGSYDLAVFRDGSPSVTYDLFRLVWRSMALHTYPNGGAWHSSLLDGGDRDKLKAWRKVGALFAVPELIGDPLTAQGIETDIDVSIDGGRTFTTVDSETFVRGAPPEQRIFRLGGEIASGSMIAELLQIRVRWSIELGTALEWAPVLVCAWAEYELLDAPARRQRWVLTARISDQAVGHDGGRLGTGEAMSEALWDAWRTQSIVTFRDIDYDLDSVTRSVRIVGIRELVTAPGNGDRWAEGTMRLTLVEL